MPLTQPTRLVLAVEAVRRAADVCRQVQQKMVAPDTLAKKDKSPVTVADFASQAIVCAKLAEAFPEDPIVGEEDASALRQEAQANLRQRVVQHVQMAYDQSVHETQVLNWIDRGNAKGTTPRYWALDPIDGTKGFLRKEQYAIALALIEDGQVTLGVLGCPNLEGGKLLIAQKGHGTQLLPLWDSSTCMGQPVHVSDMTDTAEARFCESVESGHSDQDLSVRIAKQLNITQPPVRMDSQAKYATLAQGESQIYLRLPTRQDYREKIWDHAAGLLVVQEAGGQVTDIHGAPLDFTQGQTLANNQGIIATNGPIHEQVVRVVQQCLES